MSSEAKQSVADAPLGFAPRGTNKPLAGKKPKTSIVYQHDFSGLIPGDVALAVEASLKQLGLEHEEITTVVPSRFPGGEDSETPFVRHQTEEGIEIPFGSYRVDGIGDVQMSIDPFQEVPTLRLVGRLHNKSCKDQWQRLLKLVRETSGKSSIFKGRAIRVEDKSDLLVPKLMDFDREYELAFNPSLEDELETVLFYPILNREKCQEAGIRTRMGVILEGHYGAGKSILLYKAAQLGHKQAGWGVLHITAGMVATAIALSALLEPVILVVEDIDAATHGDRDRLNFLLNRLSSVATKATGDFALLLSTNFIERIDPALLRPERIDAIVPIELPNQETTGRLIDLFGGKMMKGLGEFSAAQAELAGTTPAIISEVVRRAKIDALRHGGKVDEKRVLFHAKRMQKQRELAKPEFRRDTTGDRLAQDLHKVVEGRF